MSNFRFAKLYVYISSLYVTIITELEYDFIYGTTAFQHFQ